MKARPTAQRIYAKRITAPEALINPETKKREAILGYVDAGSYQRHMPTTRAIFAFSAGDNQPGMPAEGLDRTTKFEFVIHADSNGRAIGLDVIPFRLYRARCVPVSMEGVKTLVVRYKLDGAVAEVVQRPFNFPFNASRRAIEALDAKIAVGNPPVAGERLKGIGQVVAVRNDEFEIAPVPGLAREGVPEGDLEEDDWAEDEPPPVVVPA